MKTNAFNTLLLIAALSTISLSALAQKSDSLIDPVCGKKVDKSESYDWKYANKTYFFDSYDCRKAFKMNPQKFLLNQCTPEMITIDPVCGMKVNKESSYDVKHKGITYYFDSYECRETFYLNPQKFLKNTCAPKDSIIK